MRNGICIGLEFIVTKEELARGFDLKSLLPSRKIASLKQIANIILTNIGDTFCKVETEDPMISRYEARLTIIKTEEYKKVVKMLNQEIVDLDEVRKAFVNLTKGDAG